MQLISYRRRAWRGSKWWK